jgi:hypothetical protein
MEMPPIAGGFFVSRALLGIAPSQRAASHRFPGGARYRKKRRYLFLILLLFANFRCDRARTPKPPDGTWLVSGRDFRFFVL